MPEGNDVPTQDRNEQDILDEQFANEDAQQNETEENQDPVQKDPEKDSKEPETEPEESQDGEIEEEVSERPVYTMPVSKAQAEKKKAVEKARQEAAEQVKQEYEEKIADYEAKLSQVSTQDEADEELAKFAEENNLDVKAAKGLLDIFQKKIKTPDFSKYDEIFENQKKQQEVESHKAQVSKEFDEEVVPQIQKDFPSVSNAHINKIKKRIEELAFTKRFNTYAVADIYAVNKSEFEYKDSHTAEDPGGRDTHVEPIEEMSEEEASKLSPEDYVKWMDLQAKNQSFFIDTKSD